MTKFLKLIFCVAFTILLVGLIYQCKSSKNAISYNDQIRPIINSKCITCHGGIKKQGDLSFLFREEAITEGASGNQSIVPGYPERSEVIKRLTSDDPEKRMPQEHPPLSDEEISLLKQWIKEGAKWEDHWAYLSPGKPSLPATFDPWVQNPIDYFVLSQMQEKEWSPTNKASDEVLLRRMFLDVTGLPPSAEDYTYNINNGLDTQYWLDTLLNSPHYGEKWASFWLDLARYADSKGYEKDPHRNIWKFRDWVINALNQDKPFDEFTIEQLAGDLIPNATEDQHIATAFHRNTMTNTEGGTDDEEFRIASIVDRVNTTFEVWQATTISCVQCHSHPYDPFRHEEFYQFMAILNNTNDCDLNNEYPNIESYEPDQLEQVNELIQYIEELEGIENNDSESILSYRIKAALHPTLWIRDCDDLYNCITYSDDVLSNWGNNVNDALKRKFYFRFANVDMNNLTNLTYHYSTKSNDVKIELRLDSIGGPLISTTMLPSSESIRSAEWVGKNIFTQYGTELKSTNGRHDLIFQIINTTGKIPEGIVMLQKIELNYKDKKLSPKVIQAQNELALLRKEASLTPVMKERAVAFRRDNYLFERGNYLVRGKDVDPWIPKTLDAGYAEKDLTRLEMARWLVSEENPLTARVIVNRVWEQIFGRGIVETLEDFGTMSPSPSHPELLDYLAYTFMHDHQWSIKSLVREITSSSTYQQSSKSTKEKYSEDPQNINLARGPRFRLSSEQIRDQGLAISGLINRKIGGRSVMPNQPEGIWQVVYNANKWVTAEGAEKYRRGIYTYWKRTSPYPSMMAFDNPSREYCVSRRIRTNTPLQALVTLNDPVFVEISNAFAKKMRQHAPNDIDSQIAYGILLATGKEDDLMNETLKDLYLESLDHFQNEGYVQLISNQEDKPKITNAMGIVANAILNLDQVLTKE